jgi:hypothetical protein
MKSKKTNAKRQVVSHTVQPVVGPELTGITLKFNSGRVELTVEEAKSLYAALDSIFGPKYFPPPIIIPPIQPSEPSYPQYPQVTWTTRYDTTTGACHE